MASDPSPHASIAEQAAHWWVVLNSDEVTAGERREFAEWVRQAPDRIAAYLRTTALMQAAKAPAVRWPDTPSEVLVAEAKALHTQGLVRLHDLPRPPRSSTPNTVRRLYWSRFAMATATSVLIALGAAWFTLTSPQKYHTRFGEHRSVLLEDGSRISLNTESTIRVELRKDHRLVSLDAGEALFQVTHDPARPFDVSVGGVVVRVLGTQFNIDRTRDRVTISVVEGRVAVAPAAQGPGSFDPGRPETVVLNAADRLVVDRATPRAPEHGVNVAAVLAWTENKLVFEHTPLAQAAEEFNRYNKPRIQIRDSTLQGREISGVFKSEDPSSFLTFLARAPGVRIHEAPDGTRIVDKRP